MDMLLASSSSSLLFSIGVRNIWSIETGAIEYWLVTETIVVGSCPSIAIPGGNRNTTRPMVDLESIWCFSQI